EVIRCDGLVESFFSYYEFTKLWGVSPLNRAIATGVASGDFAYAVGVTEQDGALSVADRDLVHIAPTSIDPSEVDLGPGAVLLTDRAARVLRGEPVSDATKEDVEGGTLPAPPTGQGGEDGEATDGDAKPGR